MRDQPRPKVVHVLRAGRTPAAPSTVEERIEAVWQLTLECMAWTQETETEGEPRLRRDVVRVKRP
jgi:hypothetical protein